MSGQADRSDTVEEHSVRMNNRVGYGREGSRCVVGY